MKEFKGSYEELRKKYGFPTIEELLKVVDIDPTEENYSPLKEIVHKLIDQIDEVHKIIDTIIQPEPRFIDLNEGKDFNDSEKKEILDMFRKSMKLKRIAMISLMESSDESKAEFIKQFFSEWPKIKEITMKTLTKMKNSWDKEIKIDMEVGYLG